MVVHPVIILVPAATPWFAATVQLLAVVCSAEACASFDMCVVGLSSACRLESKISDTPWA